MRSLPLLLIACVSLFGADPWKNSDLIKAGEAAKDTRTPLVIHTGFPVLYRSAHIPGSVYAGPGSTADGIDSLRKAVASQPRDREILLYCGCCPMDKCPNLRPAFAALHEMGFTRVKVIELPTNFKTDWLDRGYPAEKRSEP